MRHDFLETVLSNHSTRSSKNRVNLPSPDSRSPHKHGGTTRYPIDPVELQICCNTIHRKRDECIFRNKAVSSYTVQTSDLNTLTFARRCRCDMWNMVAPWCWDRQGPSRDGSITWLIEVLAAWYAEKGSSFSFKGITFDVDVFGMSVGWNFARLGIFLWEEHAEGFKSMLHFACAPTGVALVLL